MPFFATKRTFGADDARCHDTIPLWGGAAGANSVWPAAASVAPGRTRLPVARVRSLVENVGQGRSRLGLRKWPGLI